MSEQNNKEELLKCPKCQGAIVNGKYGLYCKNKCGMNIRKAMGMPLTDSQIKDLLQGKKILMQGLMSKTGKEYTAYLIPIGIDDYNCNKDGKMIEGSQYRFRLEFLNEYN